jgi:hypothetical protein
MHHLMLVTLSRVDAGTSEEARRSAYLLLINDASFVGEGGRFGCPLADWFVLGGRWSGILREAMLGQPYKDALAQEFPEFAKGYYPSSLPEQHKTGLDRLWQRFGGTGSSPLTRSGYEELGADDDAMLVDQFLYDQFLKPHAGTDRMIGNEYPAADFADLDGDEVDESFIGRKWLVVVDYHN